MTTIFYSWQNHLPKINRNVIQAALDDAALELSKQFPLSEALMIDEDTSGKSGSPDIVNAILTKIDSCSLFVADLTLIDSRKPLPNPNVVFEYGYALKSRKQERIIAVMNEAFGPPEKLPFDLKFRRCSILYDLTEGASRYRRVQQQKLLTGQFLEAFKSAVKEDILQIQSVYETRGPLIF